MREAVIDPHAAPVRHDRPGVGRHRCRLLPPDHDVRRRAVAMLAVRHAAHLGVVLRRPVAAVDGDRRAEAVADSLQYHHQPGRHQHRVRAILAGKFADFEIAGQIFGAVLRLGIGVDFYHGLSSFRFFVPLPEQQQGGHLAGAGDLGSGENPLCGAASVQHQRVLHPQPQQLVLQLLPGHGRLAAPEAHLAVAQPAHGGSGGFPRHVRRQGAVQLRPAFQDGNAGEEAAAPVGKHPGLAVVTDGNAPVLIDVPADNLPVHHRPPQRLEAGVEEVPVDDVGAPGFGLDGGRGQLPGVVVNLRPGAVKNVNHGGVTSRPRPPAGCRSRSR